jgi:hypothetical protein
MKKVGKSKACRELLDEGIYLVVIGMAPSIRHSNHERALKLNLKKSPTKSSTSLLMNAFLLVMAWSLNSSIVTMRGQKTFKPLCIPFWWVSGTAWMEGYLRVLCLFLALILPKDQER